MYNAYVWRDGQSGFTVWLHSALTGSKVECLGHFNSKRSAVACVRAWRKRNSK
jgi:hypothetical protein